MGNQEQTKNLPTRIPTKTKTTNTHTSINTSMPTNPVTTQPNPAQTQTNPVTTQPNPAQTQPNPKTNPKTTNRLTKNTVSTLSYDSVSSVTVMTVTKNRYGCMGLPNVCSAPQCSPMFVVIPKVSPLPHNVNLSNPFNRFLPMFASTQYPVPNTQLLPKFPQSFPKVSPLLHNVCNSSPMFVLVPQCLANICS